ncbi:hypothetical protein A5663_18115 [Mycobacterium sp. E740]|nr:hypothetical protein A5663_18115 [Mycobacterium sp. E740]
MVIDPRKVSLLSAGIAAALFAAPQAVAEPPVPVPPPPPPAAPSAPVAVVAASAPAPAPGADAPAPAGAPTPPPPPQGVSHLASPDSLPPGTTMDPSVRANDRPNVNYLKDLWHAVQNQEISGKEALIMGLSQRRLNAPYPQQAPGPNVPMSPGNPPAGPPPPAPPVPAPAPPAPAHPAAGPPPAPAPAR